jgi:hypothetical protein
MHTARAIKPRRLLLAALDWMRTKDPPISLGAASIVASMRDADVSHKSWAVNHESFAAEEVVDWVMQEAARSNSTATDFAVGAFIWNEHATQQILQRLRAAGFPGRIIVGGPQVSYVAQNVQKFYPDADVFIRGYAEQALAAMYSPQQSDEQPAIAGVHYRGERDLGKSAQTKLTELPSPFLTGEILPTVCAVCDTEFIDMRVSASIVVFRHIVLLRCQMCTQSLPLHMMLSCAAWLAVSASCKRIIVLAMCALTSVLLSC